MKKNIFLKNLFLLSVVAIAGCSFDKKVIEGSLVKKYGIVANPSDVIYISPYRLQQNNSIAYPYGKVILRKGEAIPQGGIIIFKIELPFSDTTLNSPDHIHYEVKSLDGRIIKERKGGKYSSFIASGYNDGPNGRKWTNYIYYDSLHINQPINGPFQIFLYDSLAPIVNTQRYKVIPDIKK